MSPAAEIWRALRHDAGVLRLDHRVALIVRGGESADLLHRVTSQDTRGMEVGAGAPACVLTAKGKLLAFFELFRVGEDCFVVEIDRSRVEGLRGLIDRFIFTEQVELAVPDWSAVGVFGPHAADYVDGVPEPGHARAEGEGFLFVSDLLGVTGITYHGPGETAARFAEDQSLPQGGLEEWDALRIDAGIPRYGVDADETTIPLEANLDRACHREKGCYIGQEVIARIDTYGHVNRQLCRVLIDGDAVPEPNTLVFDEGDEAGRITSAYLSPVDGKVHALAMLPLVLAESGTALHIGTASGSPAAVL